eukprot:715368-Prymnesium_polylepis.1
MCWYNKHPAPRAHLDMPDMPGQLTPSVDAVRTPSPRTTPNRPGNLGLPPHQRPSAPALPTNDYLLDLSTTPTPCQRHRRAA